MAGFGGRVIRLIKLTKASKKVIPTTPKLEYL